MTEMSADTTQAMPAAVGNKLFPLSLSKLSLATVNKGLGLLTVAALIIFLFTLMSGAFKLMGVNQHIRGLEVKGDQEAASAAPAKEFVKPAVVDPALDNRNIFQPAGAAVSTSGDAAEGISGVSTYRLVGISMAKNLAETYVMIENSQTKLTYFLQYNQPVEGLELEKILEDKVIVKIGGKAVEFE